MSDVPNAATEKLIVRKVAEDEPIQVLFVFPEFTERFKDWLDSLGLQLFPIPVPENQETDDYPTFGIGPKQDVPWKVGV